MLIAAAYEAAGIVPAGLDIPDYPQDIMFHSDDDRYLAAVLDYCDEVDEPVPGGIALFKFGRAWSHGAIVINWPIVIHAYAQMGEVIEMSVMDDMRLARRPVRFFSPRGAK